MKKSDQERTEERFHEILSKYPVQVHAKLESGIRGRGLFANRSFKAGQSEPLRLLSPPLLLFSLPPFLVFSHYQLRAGEVTVAVPLELCIFHEIDLENVKYEDRHVEIDAAGNISDLDKKRIAWTSEIALTGKLMEVLEKAAFDGTGDNLLSLLLSLLPRSPPPPFAPFPPSDPPSPPFISFFTHVR
eukprot:751091-Hanusia_phi.AAC.1